MIRNILLGVLVIIVLVMGGCLTIDAYGDDDVDVRVDTTDDPTPTPTPDADAPDDGDDELIEAINGLNERLDQLNDSGSDDKDDGSDSGNDDRDNNDRPSRTSSGKCEPGDGKGPWSEGNNPHRIEVGGHGIQHFDFHPEVGLKSISFGVGMIDDPGGVPDLAWGYGSLWEWNPPNCDYDLEADMIRYAEARLDSGHSGLVVEWGSWEILENVGDLSDEEARELVDLYVTAFEQSEDSEGTSPFDPR